MAILSLLRQVPLIIRHQPPQKIQPDNTPLHELRHWTQKDNTYQGYYRTRYGAWKGKIMKRWGKFDVFIFNPPVEKLKNHNRWHCFHDEGRGKWRINLYKNPTDGDVGAIIFYVERLILDSFKM